MKKTMTDYVNALSDQDFEILEDIFENKFLKFRMVYDIISGYSEYISNLKYKKTKKEILKIEVTINTKNIDDIMSEIISYISENDIDNVLICNEGNVVKIEISKDETEHK